MHQALVLVAASIARAHDTWLLQLGRRRKDLATWTIEHIAPQNPLDEASRIADDVLGQVGNLMLMPSELNEKLKHKSFSRKKVIVAEFEGYSFPTGVQSARTWNAAAIEARTTRLAEHALGQVWKP